MLGVSKHWKKESIIVIENVVGIRLQLNKNVTV